MKIDIKQISSLEKVRVNDNLDQREIYTRKVLAGERVSYQLSMKSVDAQCFVKVSLETALANNVKLYVVKDAYMDTPVTEIVEKEDYITLEPGFMPDILIPLEETNNCLFMRTGINTIWVKVDIPKNITPGIYPVKIKLIFKIPNGEDILTINKMMMIEVISAVMPEQKLIYTRWLYLDCIAMSHNVEIFSQAHWNLIEEYISAASDVGINMILVPIHTPPLDTEIGAKRQCVQLVDIEKKGEEYVFSFERFNRFIDICKRNGIQYFEMAHLFSQWGAKYAPNIMVTVNGRKEYLFGWNVAADSPKYRFFLMQYIPAISNELKRKGISKKTYFHISDEPTFKNIDTYKKASELIRPLIGDCKIVDALSDYIFYEQGLMECPVTNIKHINDFLEKRIENQWLYYCCVPQKVFPNSFMAMQSYRIRILGFLLYRYDIKGFLHWGFNFYNSSLSVYPINPYLTTSGDGSFPSGDPFIVYPAKNGVYTSIRGEITYEAIQDMNICYALENRIGRENVVQMIDDAAGQKIRFDAYPKSSEFLEELRTKMIERIEIIDRMNHEN